KWGWQSVCSSHCCKGIERLQGTHHVTDLTFTQPSFFCVAQTISGNCGTVLIRFLAASMRTCASSFSGRRINSSTPRATCTRVCATRHHRSRSWGAVSFYSYKRLQETTSFCTCIEERPWTSI